MEDLGLDAGKILKWITSLISIIVSYIFISLLLVTVGIMYSKMGSNINVIIGILCDGENISFVASLVTYINSTNIPPIMIMDRIYENQNLLYIVPPIRHTIVVCVFLSNAPRFPKRHCLSGPG